MNDHSSSHSSTRLASTGPRKSCGTWNFVAVLGLLLVALVSVGGCSDDEGRPGPSDGFGGDGGSLGSGVAQGECEQGAERACGYKVKQGKDSVTCYQGVQQCEENGRWGECGSGTLITMPKPDEKEGQAFKRGIGDFDIQGTAHVGNGSTCTPADLCDPYCYELQETTPIFTPAVLTANSVLCPTTTALTECGSAVGCEHSLCTTGVKLTAASCGTCAAKVCAAGVLPSCCSSTWDSACVNKALEVCLGSPPPLGLCDFGVFAESTLITANSPKLGTASKIGAGGDLRLDTDSTKFPGTVYAKGDIWVNNFNGSGLNIPLPGGIWATGSVGFGSAGNPYLQGDVHAGEGILFENLKINNGWAYSNYNIANASLGASPSSSSYNIEGRNTAQYAVSVHAKGAATSISGVTAAPASATKTQGDATVFVPTINIPPTIPNPSTTTCAGTTSVTAITNVSVSGSTPNQTITISNGVLSLPPGNYGSVVLSNAAKLVLSSAGQYTFKSLNGSGGNHGGIQLGAAMGSFSVTVCGKFSLGNTQNIIGSTASVTNNGTGAAADTPVVSVPTQLVLSVLDTDTSSSPAVTFGNDVNFTGILRVPDGTFKGGNNNCSAAPATSCHGVVTTFNGAIWANKFDIGTNFNFTQISKASCEGLSLTGTTVPANSTATCTSLDAGAPAATPGIQASNVNSVTPSTGVSTACTSGSDCQTNMRCIDVESRVGSAQCTNFNKCVASGTANGGPSVLPCAADVCVARIIANHSGCGTNWTSTCVGYVQTECDATCGSPTTNRSGTCVANSSLAAEANCTGTNGFDLAVGYVCTANQVPVCNHGSTNFTGTVPLSWWTLTNRQFAPLTTPTATATGTFMSASITINAGTCTTINTGTAMSSANDYTVMVDPNWTKSECNNASAGGNTGRRLDNWSWYNHSYTCTSTPNIAEYDYVADCSSVSGTAPRWRLLRWGAAPGASQTVKFYAKVDSTTPACTGSSGADPCTIVANNSQTAVTFPSGGGTPPVISAGTPCALSATNSNCAVSLTTALGLPATKPQSKNLTIRAEWPIGVATPTWDVTYTCEYDQ